MRSFLDTTKMKLSECEKGYRRWISPDNPPVNTPKQMSDVTTNHIYAALDLAKERDALYAENQSLRTQLKSVEAESAVMREALEYSKTHNHRDNFKGRVSCHGHECPTCDTISQALATNAGKSLLERLKEAEWLISQANLPTRDRTGRPDWWARRDAFLNPKPQDVKP